MKDVYKTENTFILIEISKKKKWKGKPDGSVDNINLRLVFKSEF